MTAIIVHGGAGAWERGREAAEAGTRRAAAGGWRILSDGGSALDAVEAAVRILEDDPVFNAGTGAVVDKKGDVAVDAAIAVSDGDKAPRLGAVGAVPRPYTSHPISLARRLMEAGEHAFLVAGGAVAWAAELGLPIDANTPSTSPHSGDTVGAVAVDKDGRMAAATSTGGTAGKRPGRVGDSPLFGAGLWVETGVCAVSATGHGESILRTLLCRDVGARLARMSPDEAARTAVEDIRRRTDGEAGVIVVVPGAVAHFTTSKAMPWAAFTVAGETFGT